MVSPGLWRVPKRGRRPLAHSLPRGPVGTVTRFGQVLGRNADPSGSDKNRFWYLPFVMVEAYSKAWPQAQHVLGLRPMKEQLPFIKHLPVPPWWRDRYFDFFALQRRARARGQRLTCLSYRWAEARGGSVGTTSSWAAVGGLDSCHQGVGRVPAPHLPPGTPKPIGPLAAEPEGGSRRGKGV